MVSAQYDSESKALYVKLAGGAVSCSEPLNDSVFLDLGEDDTLLGTEVLVPEDVSEDLVKRITSRA